MPDAETPERCRIVCSGDAEVTVQASAADVRAQLSEDKASEAFSKFTADDGADLYVAADRSPTSKR